MGRCRVSHRFAVCCAVACLVLAAGSPSAVAQSKQQPSQSKGAQASGPTLQTEFGPVEIFPADSPWNQPIDTLPVHANSRAFIESIGVGKPVHPDFGTEYQGAPNGIPYVVVSSQQSKTTVEFKYADESDPGPYPIPANPPIEGGPKGKGDRHILMIDAQNKKLYELFSAHPKGDAWKAGSGAVFDLTTNQLRPLGWTSADAAGLPIFPGLVRYDEAVEKGEIDHALRFTCQKTQRGYILPATHFASSSSDAKLPPMGLRLRLRADFDASRIPRQSQAIVRALKKYGMLLADNGGDWFVSGAPHPKWDDDDLHALTRIKGGDFEVVETGPIVSR